MYFFFDLDGTLLGMSRQLNEENRIAIEQLHEKGHKIFLCSGRTPEYLMKGIAKSLPVDGIVGCAGGVVWLDGKYIYENALDKEAVKRLAALFDSSRGIAYRFESKEAAYLTDSYIKINEMMMKAMEQSGQNIAKALKDEAIEETLIPIADLNPEETAIQKVLFYRTDEHAFDNIQEEIDADYHTVYYYDSPQIAIGELIPVSCTKADGVRAVMDYYGADMSQAVGFGDGMNDYQMMEVVGTAVVYEKGPDELKALADYFFIDPDLGGLGKVLKEMGLVL